MQFISILLLIAFQIPSAFADDSLMEDFSQQSAEVIEIEFDADEPTEIKRAIDELEMRTELPNRGAFEKFIHFNKSEFGLTTRLALVVGTLNSVAMTWTLLSIPGATFAPAVSIGILMGFLSGSLRMFPQKIAAFLEPKGKPFIEKILRWFGIEFTFLSIEKIGATAVGLSLQGGVEAVQSVALASAFATPVQGIIDLAISKLNRIKLSEAKTEEEKVKIRRNTNMLFVISGVISTSLAVATSHNIPGARSLMFAMGVAGMGMYGYISRKEKCVGLVPSEITLKE